MNQRNGKRARALADEESRMHTHAHGCDALQKEQESLHERTRGHEVRPALRTACSVSATRLPRHSQCLLFDCAGTDRSFGIEL